MADIAPKLLTLSAEKLMALHERIHKSAPTAASIEVHHTILNEMARRKMERPTDSWDEYEILVDSITEVDLTSLKSSLPEGLVEEVIKSGGTTLGNVQTFLTVDGYEMRIEPIVDEVEKMIREEKGKYTVYDKTGKRRFGTYNSRKEAEDRLAQMHAFPKADYRPPKAVQDAAARALEWIRDGKAGSGFTAVGARRASQLAQGESISLDTLKRMKSFFARHEVDKRAIGFSRGETGYPSAGRVAWDAWGGDAGYAWAEAMVARAESDIKKHLQGQHDQQSHAPNFADKIAQGIMNGEHPSVDPLDVGPLMSQMAKRTDHPDLTELKVSGTMLYGDEGMGIARKDMPQIPAERRDEFLSDLAKEGIKTSEESVDPKTLKPIQKEVSASRSGAIYERYKEAGAIPEQQRILISSDGFVIDGHHTWGAAVAFSFENKGATLPVYRIDMTAKDALARATAWGDAAGIPKQALDAKEPAKKASTLVWKHGEHDQVTHGNWARGTDMEIAADKPVSGTRSPEAARLATDLRRRSEAIEPVISGLMKDLAAESGGEFVQYDQRLKSTDSLARKIDADAEKDYDGDREMAARNISDAIRYTLEVPEQSYTENFDRTVGTLQKAGWEIRAKNFWQSGDPYDGVNIKATKDGVSVELQLHTTKSLAAKSSNHDVYETYRTSRDDAERLSLWNKMVDTAKGITRPANYAQLLTMGSLVIQQFETAQQAGLLKSTLVSKMWTIRGGGQICVTS